jgi:hypothetical protein
MHRHPILTLSTLVAATLAGAVHAGADEAKPPDAHTLGFDPGLSLDPTAPQVGALPGGLAPAYGQKALSEGEWRFDFHGFLSAPLNVGLNSRANPGDGASQSTLPVTDQSGTVFHTPPVVPDDLETFSHTGVVPTTYAQLNFSEGNSIVTGNVSIIARQSNVSTSFVEPASQLGITDVFLSILPRTQRLRTEVLIGAFTSRYGSPGEYDEGRYGTPLIARVNGVGEQINLRLPVGGLLLIGTEGLVGQSNKAAATVTPDIWNDFANPNAGSSFVAHGHLGAAYGGRVLAGLHYLHAWSQDDRGNPSPTVGAAPDARMDIYAADLRLELGRFGHGYLAGSYTNAQNVATLSRVISVLDTNGGQGLIDNYLGPDSVHLVTDPATGVVTGVVNGSGNLTTVGFQYDLSIGKLISYPVPFSGDGPDLFVSAFGILTHVNSDDSFYFYDANNRYYHNVTKLKLGALATYSFLSWLAATLRYDWVNPDLQDTSYSFAVVSPAVIFRTDWTATNQVVLQYSHWFNGGNTLVRVGDPPHEVFAVPTGSPVSIADVNVISLSATMWW